MLFYYLIDYEKEEGIEKRIDRLNSMHSKHSMNSIIVNDLILIFVDLGWINEFEYVCNFFN